MMEQPNFDKLERLITLREACRVTKCRHSFLRQLIDEGKLTAWQRGNRLMIDRETMATEILKATRYIPLSERAGTNKPAKAGRQSPAPIHPLVTC